LGRTRILTIARQVYVPDEEILKEVESLPDISIDHITFSGKGDPTLAENLVTCPPKTDPADKLVFWHHFGS
jgi:wyosine [tRNA(Phe)-imidazoG37] synthetase (radical SAM superfamily)